MIAHLLRRALPVTVLALVRLTSSAQDTTAWRDSLDAYWSRMDAEFADSLTSPLTAGDRAHFTHLQHFPFDPAFRVEATFVHAGDTGTVTMRTSTTRLPKFKVYGTLSFTLDGRPLSLPVYENAVPDPRYPAYLFLPFTDLTNGDETYGAGRYLDLHAPLGERVIVDFNQAYNPYCAYSDRYSCPIPPAENHLDVAIRAGVLKYH